MSTPVDVGERGGVGEHVVERADLAVEVVALLVGVAGRLEVGVAGRVEDLDRVLFGVGVEVTGQEDPRRCRAAS